MPHARWLAGLVGGLVLLAVPAVESDRFEAWALGKMEARATAALGVPVHIGSLQIRLASVRPRFEAYNVSVELPAGQVIHAECARIFLSSRQVEIDSPRVDLDLVDGLPALAASETNGDRVFQLGPVLLRNGTFHFRGGADLDLALENVDGLMTVDRNAIVLDVRGAGRHIRGRVGGRSIEEPIESLRGQVVIRESSLEVRDARLETGSISMVFDAQAALGVKTRVTFSRLAATAPLELLERFSSLAALQGKTGSVAWNGPVSVDESGFHAAGSVAITAGPELSIGGTIAVDGAVSPLAAEGHAEIAYAGLSAGKSTRIPDGTVSGDFRLSGDEVFLRDVFASAGHSRVSLGGTVSLDGEADLRFSAEPLALDELTPIEGVQVGGTGPVTAGRITGPILGPVVEGAVDLAAFHAAGLNFGDGVGPVRLSFPESSISSPDTRFVRGETTYRGAWEVGFADGGVLQVGSREHPIEITGARVEDLVGIGVFPWAVGARGRVSEGALWLAGPFRALDGGFRSRGASLDVSGQRFASFRAKGRLDAGALWLDDLVASRDSGAQLYARGRVGAAPAHPLDLEMHASGWTFDDVDPLAALLGANPAVTSSLVAQLHAGGTLRDPDLRGSVRLENTRVGGRAIGDSHLTLQTASGELRIGGSIAAGSITPIAAVRLHAAPTRPYVASLVVADHDLTPYLALWTPRLASDAGVAASASGSVTFSGDARHPFASLVSVRVTALSLLHGGRSLTNDGDLLAEWEAGDIRTQVLRLVGRESGFSIAGRRTGGTWEASASGTLDLGFVSLMTDRFSRAEGVLDVKSLQVTGAHYRGEAEIRGGALEIPSLPIGATDTTARLSIEDRVISIRELAGVLGGGSFNLAREATVVLSAEAPCVSRFDVSGLQLAGVTVRLPTYALTGRVTGPLRVEGGSCGELPLVAGDLALEHAKYRGTGGGTEAPGGAALAGARAATVALDIGLAAPGGGIWVRNDLLNAELATRTPLRITGDDTSWGVSPGTLALVAGRLFVRGVALELRQADVEFVGDRTVDAKYTITAAKRLGFWEITVHAEGQLSRGAPRIDLKSSPPLSDDDALQLLEKSRMREEI